MPSNYIAPLNLKYILLNTLAGSSEIFLGIFFIGISILAGIFRMPSQVYLLMIALAGILLYNWLGGGFYIMIALLGGIIIFWAIARIVKT